MSAGRPTFRSGALAWMALVLHVLVGVVPYAGTGLVAPPAAVAALWSVWVALLGVWWRLRDRPAHVLAVPTVAVVVWVLVVSAGGALLGWTA